MSTSQPAHLDSSLGQLIGRGELTPEAKKDQASNWGLIFGVIFLVVALALAIVALVFWNTPGRDVSFAFAGIVAILSAICLFSWLKPSEPESTVDEINVYENGLAYLANGEWQSKTWDHVVAIYEEVYDTSINYQVTGRTYVYRVRFSDGKEIRICSNTMTKVDTVGKQLLDKAMPLILKQKQDMLGKGQQADFGPIGLSDSGIHANNRHLPWSEFSHPLVGNGLLEIHNTNGQWQKFEIKEIANLMVLLALMDDRSNRQ